ncbi:SIS domain-containing protein [Gloeocapsa sp. PCC 73106]|uniref:D-sedoheptulose-7-phosphate isomerase n=1 Tax=Gloeocapsa sp. PCC 73106 TaxID=102232 RepID=UPI0002AC48FC|nr:SIS domain-containing protein [Gloeocapsa sp. PCC 73106]ELR96425.1 phosphoheptose isomerase [Gloeocapsa sp. PCC 73106]
MNREVIIKAIDEAIAIKKSILEDTNLIATLEEAVAKTVKALLQGNKVLFCGNGGSAADAQHLAAELGGRFYKDRPPLPAEALHCNSSYITAVANDYSYAEIYSRLIKGIGKPGDVLIGLSTSGNSLNVVEAMSVAQTKEMTTIALTGFGGGKLKYHADYLLSVPSQDTARIQEAHILLGHIYCQLIEAEMFPDE